YPLCGGPDPRNAPISMHKVTLRLLAQCKNGKKSLEQSNGNLAINSLTLQKRCLSFYSVSAATRCAKR
ncbi:MAG: hypothetical protein ACOX8U_05950, partial [Bradymonadia bacterium]